MRVQGDHRDRHEQGSLMPRPRKFTEEELAELHRLETYLTNAAKSGDYEAAREMMGGLQPFLRRIGNETRLQKNKALLFEAAMNAGHTGIAIPGFVGVRKKTGKRTKIHLQAAALEAICHIRNGDTTKAEPLMSLVIARKNSIRSESRRRRLRS